MTRTLRCSSTSGHVYRLYVIIVWRDDFFSKDTKCNLLYLTVIVTKKNRAMIFLPNMQLAVLSKPWANHELSQVYCMSMTKPISFTPCILIEYERYPLTHQDISDLISIHFHHCFDNWELSRLSQKLTWPLTQRVPIRLEDPIKGHSPSDKLSI